MALNEPGRVGLPIASTPTRATAPAGRWPDQPRGFDLMGRLGLRRFFRWKYARLVFQLPLLILVVIMLIDGFTGRQLAPRNMATTLCTGTMFQSCRTRSRSRTAPPSR